MDLRALPLVLVLAACGSSSSSKAPDSGVAIDAGQAIDGATEADGPAQTADAAPQTPDAAAQPADAAVGPDAAPPQICGGFAGFQCDDGYYCDYPDNYCGGNDGTGVCVLLPFGCPAIQEPVCACDGMTYENGCLAAQAGLDVSAFGGCPPPEGMFNCGTTFCHQDTEYCKAGYGGAFDAPPSFNCVALPAGCGTKPSCACVSSEPCGDMCTEDAGGNLTLTCQYP